MVASGVVESSKAPDRELLLAHHRFPGPYTIKAFGPGQGNFSDRVHRALQEAAIVCPVELRERKSAGGNRMCVTIEMQAQGVDEVIRLYEALHRIETLQLIL